MENANKLQSLSFHSKHFLLTFTDHIPSISTRTVKKIPNSSQTIWKTPFVVHSLTHHEPRSWWHVTYLQSRHSVLLHFGIFHEVALVLNEFLELSTWHTNIRSILHSHVITEFNQSSVYSRPGGASWPLDRLQPSLPSVGKGTAWDGAWMGWGGLL